MRCVVVAAHKSNYPDPISFESGERVTLGRTDDEYPGWIWTSLTSGNAGWAPESTLRRDGKTTAVTTVAYSARELDTREGEEVVSLRELKGWLWVRNDAGAEGWIPQKTVRIGNDSAVLLRPPATEDREQFLASVRESRTLHRAWIHPPDSPEFFDRYLERFARDDHESRLLIHKESGGLVGVINLNNIIRGYFQNAFLGFYAFQRFSGQGLMAAGLRFVAQESFGPLGLHRLEANIQPTNHRSLALVERAGFQKEGYSPRYLQIAGKWCDHERWALLKADDPGFDTQNSEAGRE